jgi:hypothetical protein
MIRSRRNSAKTSYDVCSVLIYRALGLLTTFLVLIPAAQTHAIGRISIRYNKLPSVRFLSEEVLLSA